jgi:sirohydrochlorin ferrochelatase
MVRRRLPGIEARVAYADVIPPTLHDVLTQTGQHSVIVPMFLATGYHVRVDVPRVVGETAPKAMVAQALGPDAAVIAAVAERLRMAGPLSDVVVMAAAGSSDRTALADIETAVEALSAVLRRQVVPGYISTAVPWVGDAVASLRAGGQVSVGVASYLLAPGLFQRRLAGSGADVVAEPIGAHPRVVDLIVNRYLDVVT